MCLRCFVSRDWWWPNQKECLLLSLPCMLNVYCGYLHHQMYVCIEVLYISGKIAYHIYIYIYIYIYISVFSVWLAYLFIFPTYLVLQVCIFCSILSHILAYFYFAYVYIFLHIWFCILLHTYVHTSICAYWVFYCIFSEHVSFRHTLKHFGYERLLEPDLR